MTELLYTLARDPDDPEEILACDCCQQEVPTALFDVPPFACKQPGEKYRFCEVCSSSYISNEYSYAGPGDYDRVRILQNLAACTNMILERLKRIEEKLGMETTGSTTGSTTTT